MTETATIAPEPPKYQPLQPYVRTTKDKILHFLGSFFEIVVFSTVLFVCLLAFFGLMGQALLSMREFFAVVQV